MTDITDAGPRLRDLNDRLEELRTAADQADVEYREEIARLRLTDEEREAVRFCITAALPETQKLSGVAGELCRIHAATLRALLERLKDTPAALDTPSMGSVQSECSLTDAEREPVAWAVTPRGNNEEIDCEFIYPSAATAGDVALGCDGVVVPLYRHQQPTLTHPTRPARAALI